MKHFDLISIKQLRRLQLTASCHSDKCLRNDEDGDCRYALCRKHELCKVFLIRARNMFSIRFSRIGSPLYWSLYGYQALQSICKGIIHQGHAIMQRYHLDLRPDFRVEDQSKRIKLSFCKTMTQNAICSMQDNMMSSPFSIS